MSASAAPDNRCPRPAVGGCLMNVWDFHPVQMSAAQARPPFLGPTAWHLSSVIASSLLAAGALILTANTSFAQYNTDEIGGVVKDAQGGVLPGALVTAVHVASSLRVERTTDNAGRFYLPALPVGEYTQ